MIVPRTLVVIALSLATLAIASPYANDAEGMNPGGGEYGGGAQRGSSQQGNASPQGGRGGPGEGPKGTEAASGPGPSQRPASSKHNHRRALNSMPAAEIATQICPEGLCGCPIAEPGSLKCLPATLADWVIQGFECVDVKADLRSCGGCASLDAKHDCTLISNTKVVSCISGTCVVDSCLASYKVGSDNSSCVPK